jgi:type 1 glutamine amidotransferase
MKSNSHTKEVLKREHLRGFSFRPEKRWQPLFCAPGCAVLAALLFAWPAHAQHDWQKPNPLIARADVETIIGAVEHAEPDRDLRIVWVWGRDTNHGPGAHEYVRVRDAMVALLSQVPRVTVETARGFPTARQFAEADLVVMYLHLPPLTNADFTDLRAFIERGGGVVALHETAIIRPAEAGKNLARCLGMSWNEGGSKWGALFEPVRVETLHPIFNGFPERLALSDEFYWDLNRDADAEVIGDVRVGPPAHSKGPVDASALSEKRHPAIWTLEAGKGRVFGTTIGHNTFTYFDPRFRIMLFRAMAWAMRTPPDPFMPLVFAGITDDKGMVGTTDAMRDPAIKARAKAAARGEKPEDLRERAPAP